MDRVVITPRITLGKSVKTKVNSSVGSSVYWSVNRSGNRSVGCSVYWLVNRSVGSSVNNLTRWEIKL